uniref:Uncharacterized protein n=1 Tax=Anguilla anguilla TaxID=7936 RepID=A0A0E9UDE6_ANGAN
MNDQLNKSHWPISRSV